MRIKRNDEIRGKRLQKLLLDILKDDGIGDAIVWTGIDGFDKRGKTAKYLEGILYDMPLIIEVVDEQSKLEPILFRLKDVIDGKGIITLHEVGII